VSALRASGIFSATLACLKCDAVEEPDRTHDRDDGRGLHAARDQMKLVLTHTLERRLVRRLAEVPTQVLDGADVGILSIRRVLRIFMSSIVRCLSGDICLLITELPSVGWHDVQSCQTDQQTIPCSSASRKVGKRRLCDVSSMALMSHVPHSPVLAALLTQINAPPS
jgi:hypothetical protein